MQDHVDHIASLLYEGILSPSDWRAGLDAIRNCMQGGLFYHFAVDKTSYRATRTSRYPPTRSETTNYTTPATTSACPSSWAWLLEK
jgi:hypothetical protein